MLLGASAERPQPFRAGFSLLSHVTRRFSHKALGRYPLLLHGLVARDFAWGAGLERQLPWGKLEPSKFRVGARRFPDNGAPSPDTGMSG